MSGLVACHVPCHATQLSPTLHVENGIYILDFWVRPAPSQCQA